jgi:2-oxoglutarate ferredoxin oxidoreductase subunit alpha
VVFLSDGYIANGAEPWLIPDVEKLPKIQITHPTEPNGNWNGDGSGSFFLPYKRNADLARPWAIPGTPGLEHRIGGIEKQDVTGNVSYDPANHEHMVRTRAAKVAGVQPAGPDLLWTGPETGDVLIVGWGSTFGAIKAATLELRKQGLQVSACHVRYVNPLPARLGDMLRRFKHVLVPELNLGQFRMLLRNRFLVDAKGLNKIKGQPFTIHEITDGVRAILTGRVGDFEVKTLTDEDAPDPNVADAPDGG